MTANEVAALLRVSYKQVRLLVKKGEIKPIAGGGRGSDLWFSREEMQAYASGGVDALKKFSRYRAAK